jgi:dTDP-4-dehydrorhamnose reductase
MIILVLGATGMLGHMACRVLAQRHTIHAAVRRPEGEWIPNPIFPSSIHWLFGIDAKQPETILHAINTSRADVVINCIGVVKQHGEGNNPLTAIPINSLLPHQLESWCAGVRLIHISTDCVFSGRHGSYK